MNLLAEVQVPLFHARSEQMIEDRKPLDAQPQAQPLHSLLYTSLIHVF